MKANKVSIWNNENTYLQIISKSEKRLMSFFFNELLKLAFKISKFISKELYMKTYCLTETTFEFESKNWKWKVKSKIKRLLTIVVDGPVLS